MRPIYVECDKCESTYHIKHDMSENHYAISFCSFCGEKIEEVYDPNQRDMFEEEDDYDGWDDEV